MQDTPITEVSSTEWRWVIILSGLLVAVTVLPYLYAFISDSPSNDWQFMGMLYNHTDAATYLSKIREGIQGSWLFTLHYTPEPHAGAAIMEFYLALGHLARLLSIPAALAYHLARLATSFFMYSAIYFLGSTIFSKLRARRVFFGILAFGAGFGWLFILFVPDATVLPTDLNIPESIPFYATLVNPHFPLTIGLLCLLTSIFIRVFRPGFMQTPQVENGGLSVIVVTVLMLIVQPQGWVAFAVTLAAYVGIHVIRSRRLPMKELLWSALVWLTAAPFLVYYAAVVRENSAMAVWNSQNFTPSPPPIYFVLGFGLPLLLALPGLWRAIRHFEQDGDRLMLIWFIVNAALLYLPAGLDRLNEPFSLQRRLSIGMIIPIGYFGVRSLMDVWLPMIQRRRHRLVLVLLFVLIIPSNALSLLLPLFGIINSERGKENAIMLTDDENRAIVYLAQYTPIDSVILAPVRVSLWIPAYSDLRVVYGHPYETLNAQQKLEEIDQWYTGQNTNDCAPLLERYRVRYVVTNAEASGAACLNELSLSEPVRRFGNVAVYDLNGAN